MKIPRKKITVKEAKKSLRKVIAELKAENKENRLIVNMDNFNHDFIAENIKNVSSKISKLNDVLSFLNNLY